jgi:EPS-associated MarR family transcriptional regulator
MIEYKVLQAISRNPVSSQRTLAESLDVSLGKINYVLGGLVEKGIVKAQRLTSDPHKIRWKYLVTAKGIREKVRLTRRFLDQRLYEYEKIRKEIEQLRQEVLENGNGKNFRE